MLLTAHLEISQGPTQGHSCGPKLQLSLSPDRRLQQKRNCQASGPQTAVKHIWITLWLEPSAAERTGGRAGTGGGWNAGRSDHR